MSILGAARRDLLIEGRLVMSSDEFSRAKTLSKKSELIEYHRHFSHDEYKQLQ
ncbi:hypothetical protein ACJJIK_09240 [Microbulbifer sp. ZKSA006]|uniref:hypothetical protein n=1 Tax=Microbulbifer sp. ZKSA006 TaxID=3243390 RepID=UPI004039914C